MTDTMYCERANGRWEAWMYSDGQKVTLSFPNKGDAITYCTFHGYRFVEVTK